MIQWKMSHDERRLNTNATTRFVEGDWKKLCAVLCNQCFTHNQDWVDLREMRKDDSMWSSMLIIMRVVRMSEAGENKCYQKHVRYENNNTEWKMHNVWWSCVMYQDLEEMVKLNVNLLTYWNNGVLIVSIQAHLCGQ